jgi:hypothetical protein
MLVPEGIKFADGTLIKSEDAIALEKIEHFRHNNFATYCVRVGLDGKLKRFGITREEYEYLRGLLKNQCG